MGKQGLFMLFVFSSCIGSLNNFASVQQRNLTSLLFYFLQH